MGFVARERAVWPLEGPPLLVTKPGFSLVPFQTPKVHTHQPESLPRWTDFLDSGWGTSRSG